MSVTPVILAAGKGTRMKSDLPKVLHPILGKPMIHYALAAAQGAADRKPVLVIGHQSELIESALMNQDCDFVYQEEQLGTGHAVLQAKKLLLDKTDFVLVTYGDMPAVRASTLKNLVDTQQENTQGPITMLTVTVDDPRGFGRVVRDGQGAVAAVVEDADATPAQREIRELNAGMYCFDAEWLWNALENLSLSPQGEYYLTDLIAAAVDDNLAVSTVPAEDQQDLIGINNRVHLAEAARILQRRINEKWMMAGVSIPDPSTVYISPDVQVGQDTVILPHTHLQGKTEIGQGCTVGPNTIVIESRIGNNCEILSSVVEFAVMEDQVDIGPFSHLRKGAHLAEGVHLGNFGEVKDSYLGTGTKMGHFSYIGNAKIGRNVNIGAGTITCNYDGQKKHQTEIENDVFIGSDTMLVAPVHLGKKARTGAGSVVTRDIPDDSLAVGVPARIRKTAQKKAENEQEEQSS